MEIAVDPRIELLSVVQFLAGWDRPPLSALDSPYRRAVEEHFGAFRSHRSVELFRKYTRSSFSYDAVPAVMLAASPPPELRLIRDPSDSVMRRAGGRKAILNCLTALRDFAAASNFAEFVERNRVLFNRVAAETAAKDGRIAADLEGYFRSRQNSYTVVLGLLLHPGGFGIRYRTSNGEYDAISVVGPGSVRDGTPQFFDSDSFAYVCWHEFGHSFVNPEVDHYSRLFVASQSLFRAIEPTMRKQAYPDWKATVSEHIVRAATVRLAARLQGEEVGRKRLAMEHDRGFVYVGPIVEALQAFEVHPDRYPAFRDFVPEIADVLARLARSRANQDSRKR
jgi:hypothetical protein